MKRKIVVLTGPTAVGKTKYALELAKTFNGEIISCDSMQLYKGMDIGSAKPSKKELSEVKHYLIDEIDPRDTFSVATYQKMAKNAILQVFNKNKLPIITGGTGLYINSLLYEMDFGTTPINKDLRKKLEFILSKEGPEGLFKRLEDIDPQSAKRIHKNNVKRVIRAIEAKEIGGQGLKDFSHVKKKTTDYEVILLGLTREREELYDRINKRVDTLLDEGLISEVKTLINTGLTSEDISMKGIGYKEIIDFLENKYDKESARDLIKKNTRHYAKRQMTWFRRYEDMKWFDLSLYNDESKALEDIIKWVQKNI